MSTFDFETVPERRGTGAKKWERYAADVLPMWVADMDFKVADEIVAALHHRVEHGLFGYATPDRGLREAIVAALMARYGWRIAAEDIVFLPGVEPGANMTLKALLRAGDGVVVHTPIYNPILTSPGNWDLERIDVGLTLEADRYVLDEAASRAALGRARALLLCNPHNPTGKVFTYAELEAIAESCLTNDVIIISDEIHCDLIFDGRRHVPIASLAPEIAARTVTLMSASKAYNIAGLKTAFAIIPNADLRARIDGTRLGMVDSVNVMGLEATRVAYSQCGPWLQALLAQLQDNRDHLVTSISQRFPEIRMVTPEATYLAWLDCSALEIPGEAQAFFLERGRVAFSAGSEFGAGLSDYVRLNFGCSRRLLDAGLDRMARALASG